MQIHQARKALGTVAENYSDEEIAETIEVSTFFKDCFFDVLKNQGTTLGTAAFSESICANFGSASPYSK